jgi:alpha,alpha-trehalase
MKGLLNTPATFGKEDPYYVETQELALTLGQRYLDSTFCTWLATGGSTDETPRLQGINDDAALGIMFEKYSDESINGVGGGGEYEVVKGFGWSNGVLIWAVDTFGDKRRLPLGPCMFLSPYFANCRYSETARLWQHNGGTD